jgi:hypothetical protein
MKKQGRNEQEKIPFHARLNIDLNFQNFRKFIIVILLFYIAFAVIYRFMYRPFEQIHASGVFALSIFSLFLIFPAVALQPVRAILTCLILPLFWSVMLYCIYALLVRFVSNAESYFDDRPVIYQRLISQISDPEFYVKYYFEFDRWFISFPLLAIWAVYYWLKKSELRREVTTKNKP